MILTQPMLKKELKQENAKKSSFKNLLRLPKSFMGKYCSLLWIETETKWADLSKVQLQNLSNQLTNASFQMKKYF
jgi:predicted flavoprotein YhiN